MVAALPRQYERSIRCGVALMAMVRQTQAGRCLNRIGDRQNQPSGVIPRVFWAIATLRNRGLTPFS